MEEIELLELELKLIQDNIVRLKTFVKEQKESKYKQYQSAVMGELKHRSVALKSRLTKVNKLSTSEILTT